MLYGPRFSFFVAPSSSAEVLIVLPAPNAPARLLLHNEPAARIFEVNGGALRNVARREAAPSVRAMCRKVSVVWLAFSF